VSSTGTYAAPGTVARAPANALVAAVIVALFVLAAIFGAARKDITQGFDEVAHASYVAQIQKSGEAWPALEKLHLLDPRTFQFMQDENYLNHPPLFYALLAALGPKLEGHPHSLLALRLINVAIAALGVAVLLGLGLAARFPRQEFYAFAVPLACIPVLAPIAGSVNNDNLAFLGGALALLGVWQVAATACTGWLAIALAGVVAASWAKLTGLVLTGTMVSFVVAFLIWRRRLAWPCAIAVALGLMLAAAPYAIYLAQYGSPTPETPAQAALIADGARAAGWSDLPRKSFPDYFGWFVTAFIVDWMPTLGNRGAFNYAMLIVPVATLACAAAGVVVSLQRVWRRKDGALDMTVLGGALALVLTFALHVGYSYDRHVATGWLMDAYPRYYLPLMAIVPLAGLSLVNAIEAPRGRAALLAFLIAGPVVFRLFGAPLG
jgi:hypothetical protein